MIYEMKISLPFQKQAYAVFFVVILSLVRGVTCSDEIGIALEAPAAILAAAFCADTYTQEVASRRSEIQRLCPMVKRINSVYRRIVIQDIFLLSVAAAGYGLFFLFQNPEIDGTGRSGLENEACRFLVYFAAVAFGGFYQICSPACSRICGWESAAACCCG